VASLAVAHEDPQSAWPRSSAWATTNASWQVQFSAAAGSQWGRRKYWPIYEAAAEHGVHIMSHAFGSYGNPITGTGHASFISRTTSGRRKRCSQTLSAS